MTEKSLGSEYSFISFSASAKTEHFFLLPNSITYAFTHLNLYLSALNDTYSKNSTKEKDVFNER